MQHILGIIITIIGLASTVFGSTLFELASVETFALGQAVSAFRSPEAVIINPASAAAITKPFIQTSYATYYDGLLNACSLSYGTPINKNISIAIHVPIKQITAIPKTNESGTLIGQFEDTEYAFRLSGAYRLDRLSIGTYVTSHHHIVESHNSHYFSVGIGTQYQVDTWTTVGASIQNIPLTPKKWDTQYEEFLPITHTIGIAYQGIKKMQFMADIVYASDPTKPSYHYGAMWTPNEHLSIQAGMEGELGFRIGTTLHMDNLSIGYAYASHDALGTIHKLGVTIHI